MNITKLFFVTLFGISLSLNLFASEADENVMVYEDVSRADLAIEAAWLYEAANTSTFWSGSNKAHYCYLLGAVQMGVDRLQSVSDELEDLVDLEDRTDIAKLPEKIRLVRFFCENTRGDKDENGKRIKVTKIKARQKANEITEYARKLGEKYRE